MAGTKLGIFGMWAYATRIGGLLVVVFDKPSKQLDWGFVVSLCRAYEVRLFLILGSELAFR